MGLRHLTPSVIFALAAVSAWAQAVGGSPESQAGSSNPWSPWIGPAIIAVLVSSLINLFGNWIEHRRRLETERLRHTQQIEQEQLRRTHSAEAEARKAWSSVAAPALDAAMDFAARMFDVIVRSRPFSASEDPVARWPTPESVSLTDPPLEITTLFRLLRYLAASAHMGRMVPSHGENLLIDQADYYVSNKIRMALKGTLARAPYGLKTEGQEFIGSRLLSLSRSRVTWPISIFLPFLATCGPTGAWRTALVPCRTFCGRIQTTSRPNRNSWPSPLPSSI